MTDPNDEAEVQPTIKEDCSLCGEKLLVNGECCNIDCQACPDFEDNEEDDDDEDFDEEE